VVSLPSLPCPRVAVKREVVQQWQDIAAFWQPNNEEKYFAYRSLILFIIID
jgi:hypothetical protein